MLQLTRFTLVKYVLLFILPLLFGCTSQTPAPTPTPTPTAFSYGIKVLDKDTQQPIDGAEVSVEVQGIAILTVYTDSEGFTTVTLESHRTDEVGKLIVEASEYKRYSKHINFKEALPQEIRLEKLEKQDEVSEAGTPIPTSTSTPMPATPTPHWFPAPQDLGVRSSPCLRNEVDITISEGTSIQITQKFDKDPPREWVFVKSVNGVQGWTLLNESIKVNISIPEDIPTTEPVCTPPALRPAPVLLSPRTGDKAVFAKGMVNLVWDWPKQTLQPGWFFSVRVGQDAQTGHSDGELPCFHDKISYPYEFVGDLQFCEPGEYYWQAVVAARNEEFQESNPTEYSQEEIHEFVEISEVSAKEYFTYTGEEPTATPVPPTPTPIPPTDTPVPPPTEEIPPTNTPRPDDGGDNGGGGGKSGGSSSNPLEP